MYAGKQMNVMALWRRGVVYSFYVTIYVLAAGQNAIVRIDCGTHCDKIKRADGNMAPHDGIGRHAGIIDNRACSGNETVEIARTQNDMRLYATVRVNILIWMRSFRCLANDEC
ncbi:hypothetical protein N7G274_004913 [Stereocaulon virgatum]|uniref:Secreted protein n=1 Tax=Stereocaulon virgatum TaxID=373712 RepID=A0ABR4AC24_9LECA